MKAQLSRLMRDATAVRAIEYGLITAGFAAAIFAISTGLGSH
jgi:Flp pilus assembly pilin Flp